VAGSSTATTGLLWLRQRWASTRARRLAEEQSAGRRRSAEFVVEVLPCQRPGKRQRLGVYERLAQREAAPPPALPPSAAQRAVCPALDDLENQAPAAAGRRAGDGAQRAVWQRLKDADLPRDAHATAFRVLHGCLYVAGFLCHIRVVPPAQACCVHPACHECLDDLLHVLFECPVVAPAAAWVCSLFAAVSGEQPPPVDPQVLLADDQAVWHPHRPALQHLWTNLRVAYLHAVWVLYCKRHFSAQPFSAATVCGVVVSALKAAIWRDWKRAMLDLTKLDGTYAAWFRGRTPALQLADFKARWAHRSVLCAVGDGAGGARLTVHLSLHAPVPAPDALPQPLAAPSPGPPGPPLPLAEPLPQPRDQ
jgi:hypothetical protein